MKSIFLIILSLFITSTIYADCPKNMTAYKVPYIVDGDTFDVSPGVTWKALKIKRIRPAYLTTPERGKEGFKEAKKLLSDLILNKEVCLKIYKNKTNCKKLTWHRCFTEVYFEGKRLDEYFPKIWKIDYIY